MTYQEIIAKLISVERTKIAKSRFRASTKASYQAVIGTVETLALTSEVTRWWFFRTTDTFIKLEQNLALPKDFGKPREKLSKSQRALIDYNIKLRNKIKKVLKEYLTGDRVSVVLKVKNL